MSCEMVRNANLSINERLNIQGRNNHVSDEIKVDPETQAMKDALKDWWIDHAFNEINKVAPKAVEYSSVDLTEYGRTLAMVMGRLDVTEEEATEIGIWGYLVGKIARWTGAIKEGRRPSGDTLDDIAIYTKMAQRNRDVGGWPFPSNSDIN